MTAVTGIETRMPAPAIREHTALGLAGIPAFFAGAAGVIVGTGMIVLAVATDPDDPSVLLIIAGSLIALASGISLGGLFTVAPGEARVLQFLGRYVGTVRADGLRWA